MSDASKKVVTRDRILMIVLTVILLIFGGVMWCVHNACIKNAMAASKSEVIDSTEQAKNELRKKIKKLSGELTEDTETLATMISNTKQSISNNLVSVVNQNLDNAKALAELTNNLNQAEKNLAQYSQELRVLVNCECGEVAELAELAEIYELLLGVEPRLNDIESHIIRVMVETDGKVADNMDFLQQARADFEALYANDRKYILDLETEARNAFSGTQAYLDDKFGGLTTKQDAILLGVSDVRLLIMNWQQTGARQVANDAVTNVDAKLQQLQADMTNYIDAKFAKLCFALAGDASCAD
ncbi:hypothetical protein FWF93_03050 [Candidatus Saccharibacteria bacterium]|nr:hypothetical protein [Candidatus Saccharibacteria bacterium]